jgi:hypothetical protein
MDLKEIVSEVSDERDRYLLSCFRATDMPTSATEQARTVLQMRMLDRFVESMNKNSGSADKLAQRLNWLTFVIAASACVAAFAAIVQMFK